MTKRLPTAEARTPNGSDGSRGCPSEAANENVSKAQKAFRILHLNNSLAPSVMQQNNRVWTQREKTETAKSCTTQSKHLTHYSVFQQHISQVPSETTQQNQFGGLTQHHRLLQSRMLWHMAVTIKTGMEKSKGFKTNELQRKFSISW